MERLPEERAHVLDDLDTLEHVIVVKHTSAECEMREGRDVWFHEAMEKTAPECPAEDLDAEHPLYVLYTSGSTAKPKGVVHTTGGYLTGVSTTHRYVFDIKPEKENETGAIMIAPLPGITATKPGSATQPLPGIAADIRDERDSTPVGDGRGLLVLRRPWPSMLRTLYKEEEFVQT